MDLLAIATAGSVDDGKSTLIGRLLYDSKSLCRDQVESVERASRRLGRDTVDLALFTDGLRAEREQGITIDVAYRYFATPNRAFVVADTPGHVQYTRNMVCGASVSELAIVLVDARHGMTEQTRRHVFLLALLGVPRLVLAVNKMDLVGRSRERFEEITTAVADFAAQLGAKDVTAIPMSALSGENVVAATPAMPWYPGPTLLDHLEAVPVGETTVADVRFPVQYVLRPRSDEFHDFRGYAGQLVGGVLRVGDEVTVLPSGQCSTVAAIDGPRGPVDEARPPLSVTVSLADDLDIGRGDLICHRSNPPAMRSEVDAVVCWMDREPIQTGARLLLKQAGRTVLTRIKEIPHRIDVNTLARVEGGSLGLNDVGRVRMRTAQPVLSDDYVDNRSTGSFILIDPRSNRTVAAGIVDTGVEKALAVG